jgi:hypothetical protein
MSSAQTATSPREAAREWIAETLRTHLRPELQPRDEDRIRRVAEAVELEAYRCNMPVETAVELAVEWCEARNGEARLSHGFAN